MSPAASTLQRGHGPPLTGSRPPLTEPRCLLGVVFRAAAGRGEEAVAGTTTPRMQRGGVSPAGRHYSPPSLLTGLLCRAAGVKLPSRRAVRGRHRSGGAAGPSCDGHFLLAPGPAGGGGGLALAP